MDARIQNTKVKIWMCTKCYDVITHPHCVKCNLPAWTLGKVLKYMTEHGQWLQDSVYTYPVTSQPLQE